MPYVSSYLGALDLLINQNQPEQAREMMVTTTLPSLMTYHQAYEDFVAQRRIVFATSPVSIDGKLFISIRVTDSGIGIAQEDLSRIFQHGFTRSEGGHGFGLHAAAIDAGRMGGKLSVHSAGIGQGATFTLTIPAIERRSEVHA